MEDLAAGIHSSCCCPSKSPLLIKTATFHPGVAPLSWVSYTLAIFPLALIIPGTTILLKLIKNPILNLISLLTIPHSFLPSNLKKQSDSSFHSLTPTYMPISHTLLWGAGGGGSSRFSPREREGSSISFLKFFQAPSPPPTCFPYPGPPGHGFCGIWGVEIGIRGVLVPKGVLFGKRSHGLAGRGLSQEGQPPFQSVNQSTRSPCSAGLSGGLI